MSRRPVSNRNLAALGRFQGEIERPSNFRQQAMDHNLGRNVKVAKLLGYLGLLRQDGVSLAGVIECAKAEPQNFSSSRSMTHYGFPAAPHQAAHFLPGRIRIGGRDVWHLAAARPVMRDQMEFLFAEVEHVPVALNQADSEAEGNTNGLRSALVQVCTTLVRQPASQVGAGQLPLDLMQSAYEEWHRRALTALTEGIASKMEKDGVPALVGDPFEGYTLESLSAASSATSKQQNRDNALRGLRYYIEDQQERSWQWVMTGCQWALREVQSHYEG